MIGRGFSSISPRRCGVDEGAGEGGPADGAPRGNGVRVIATPELIAETDKGPGVLMASGYIAGGAIAGIVIALTAGVFVDIDTWFNDWSIKNNPFFQGAYSDALSLLPFR